jgi:glutaredoxin 3
MNFAYYRKSTYDRSETVKNIKNQAKKLGLELIGETAILKGKGVVLHLCNLEWLEGVIKADKNLIGLLPCSVAVIEDNKEVFAGVGSAAVLGGVTENAEIAQIAHAIDEKLKELVKKAAGVGPLKAKNVKVYSTTTCPYCKMEASWLDQNKVKYEEVHVDLNQAEAEKLAKKTGQMGVPVTEITYDNGDEEYIVGFDRERLKQILRR